MRLIETSETKPSGPYASFSHRWGSSHMFRCLLKNIDILKERLPVPDLPLAFQEVFQVFRFLEVKYVWIDSICIVQDSDSDWLREASLMMKVYQQACINLAATVSSNSQHASLFKKRNPDTLMLMPFEIGNGILNGQYQAIEAILYRESWDRTIERAALNTRGWVLQERLLSSRVAHFTTNQIVWDCLSCATSESIPFGALAQPLIKTVWIGHKQDSRVYHIPEADDEILGEWATVVNAYSRCHFTFDIDKTIAMDGIISVFEGRLGKRFICAMSSTQIEMQLCWFASESSSTCHSRNDMAPTWSWVSITGPVDMPQVDLYKDYAVNLFAAVKDVSNLDHIHDARGKRYMGSILLRCFLNPVELSNERGNSHLVGCGMEYVISIMLDTPAVSNHHSFYLAPIFEV